jgi:hypothetical protein
MLLKLLVVCAACVGIITGLVLLARRVFQW